MSKDELVKLKEKELEARRVIESLGHINVANRTPEELVEIDANYARAQVEYELTSDTYYKALRLYTKENP